MSIAQTYYDKRFKGQEELNFDEDAYRDRNMEAKLDDKFREEQGIYD